MLVSYLGDKSLTEALLGALVDVSQASPSSLVSFLPTLRIVGQQNPALLGHAAKIHGAVGVISEVKNAPTQNVPLNAHMQHIFPAIRFNSPSGDRHILMHMHRNIVE